MIIDPRVASCLAPVLITGETGTGKDVAARAVHEMTRATMQRTGDFVAVNCAALPETLAESELFGHVRGAFTGADTRSGAFVLAAKGTLFLDEIGDASRLLQAKLLRALDSGSVTPLGGAKPISVTCRIVCATNVDLHAAVARGDFRADLLHRIDVLRVRVRPLREREDFDDIARAVMMRVNDECGTKVLMDAELLRRLRAYPWPGNVRELRNALTRLATGQDIGLSTRETPENKVFREPRTIAELEQMQVAMVERALHRSGGNVAAAARDLGVNRTTLHEWMRKVSSGNAAKGGASVLMKRVEETAS